MGRLEFFFGCELVVSSFTVMNQSGCVWRCRKIKKDSEYGTVYAVKTIESGCSYLGLNYIFIYTSEV